MADDIDAELELAKGRAAARRRREVEQRAQAATAALGERAGQLPALPRGSEELFGPASASGAALRGFGQGASLGFADELAGIARGAMMTGGKLAQAPLSLIDEPRAKSSITELGEWLGTRGAGEKSAAQAVLDAYRAGRDEAQLELAQSRKARPVTTTGAELSGAVAMPLPKVSRLGGAPLTRVGEMAATGALAGGLSGLGTSQADLTRGDVGGALGDVAKGAAFGGVAGPLVGTAAQRAGSWLAQRAPKNILKAIGVRAGITEQMGQLGYETPEDVLQFAREAQSKGIVPVWGTAADVARRAEERLPISGSLIEDALQRGDINAAHREALKVNEYLDELAKAKVEGKGRPVWPQPEEPFFNVDEAAWRAARNVMGPEGLSTTAARESPRAQALIGDILATEDATFRAANKLKSDMYKGISYAIDPTLKTEMERKVAAGLRKSIEEQMAETAGPEAAEQLAIANREWGLLQDVLGLSREEAKRQMGRAAVTPFELMTAMMGGAAGSAAAGPMGAVAGATPLLWRYLTPYSHGAAAAAQQAVAPIVSEAGPALARALTLQKMRPSGEEEVAAAQRTLAGQGAVEAQQNAYDELSRRFGITPTSKDEAAQEAFLLQQRGQLAPRP